MIEFALILTFFAFYFFINFSILGLPGRRALLDMRPALATVIVFTPFFLVTAFRDFSMGVDTYAYYYEYLTCSGDCYVRRSEPVFSFVIQFFNYIGADFRGFLIVQSLVYYFSLSVLFLMVRTDNLFLCATYALCMVVFGIFGFGLSGVRQSMAISLFLLSVPFVLNKKFAVYFFFGFFAFFIHNSAIVPFVIAFVCFSGARLRPRAFLMLIAASPIALLVNPDFLEIFSVFDFKQSSYLTGESFQTINFKVPLTFYLLALLIALVVNFVPSRLIFHDVYQRLFEDRFLSFCACSVVIVSYFLWLAMSVRLLERVTFYFIPLVGVFLVAVFDNVRNVMWVLMLKLAVFVFLLGLSIYIGGAHFTDIMGFYF